MLCFDLCRIVIMCRRSLSYRVSGQGRHNDYVVHFCKLHYFGDCGDSDCSINTS